MENVVVENENDKKNMKLANTIRLGVRQVRLEAEKIFDAKRAEKKIQSYRMTHPIIKTDNYILRINL